MSDEKWDAAFMHLNNPSRGFDFENSPFGNDQFDHYDRHAEVFKYSDIYTGFIFYGGIPRWTYVVGIPDIWKDDSGIEEMVRRDNIAGGVPINEINRMERKEVYNEVRNVGLARDITLDSIMAKIYYWYKDPENDGKK